MPDSPSQGDTPAVRSGSCGACAGGRDRRRGLWCQGRRSEGSGGRSKATTLLSAGRTTAPPRLARARRGLGRHGRSSDAEGVKASLAAAAAAAAGEIRTSSEGVSPSPGGCSEALAAAAARPRLRWARGAPRVGMAAKAADACLMTPPLSSPPPRSAPCAAPARKDVAAKDWRWRCPDDDEGPPSTPAAAPPPCHWRLSAASAEGPPSSKWLTTRRIAGGPRGLDGDMGLRGASPDAAESPPRGGRPAPPPLRRTGMPPPRAEVAEGEPPRAPPVRVVCAREKVRAWPPLREAAMAAAAALVRERSKAPPIPIPSPPPAPVAAAAASESAAGKAPPMPTAGRLWWCEARRTRRGSEEEAAAAASAWAGSRGGRTVEEPGSSPPALGPPPAPPGAPPAAAAAFAASSGFSKDATVGTPDALPELPSTFAARSGLSKDATPRACPGGGAFPELPLPEKSDRRGGRAPIARRRCTGTAPASAIPLSRGDTGSGIPRRRGDMDPRIPRRGGDMLRRPILRAPAAASAADSVSPAAARRVASRMARFWRMTFSCCDGGRGVGVEVEGLHMPLGHPRRGKRTHAPARRATWRSRSRGRARRPSRRSRRRAGTTPRRRSGRGLTSSTSRRCMRGAGGAE